MLFLNRWPLASGAGSTDPWRAFIVINLSLNGTPAEARAHRRRIHEQAIVDPAYAIRRGHPNGAELRERFEAAMVATGDQYTAAARQLAGALAPAAEAFAAFGHALGEYLTPEMIAELEAMPDDPEAWEDFGESFN